MRGFAGGSAWAMAREISEGFVLVTARTVQGLSASQRSELLHEVDRLMRELRGAAVAGEPLLELQRRQRRIQRLNATTAILRSLRQRVRS